jgi:hypothetical protein
MSSVQIPVRVSQFFRKMPRPVKIVADDKHEIPVPNGGRVWPDIWRTLSVIKPEKLTAYDADNKLLRALDMEKVGADEDESGDKSDDMSDLQFFGKLLDGAYDKAGNNYAKIIAEAMKFIEQQSGRLIAADRELDRLRQENAKLRRELAEIVSGPAADEAPGGFVGAMIHGALSSPAGQALLSQAVGGGAPPQGVRSKSNGAKKES